jgi:hypothetical protein
LSIFVPFVSFVVNIRPGLTTKITKLPPASELSGQRKCCYIEPDRDNPSIGHSRTKLYVSRYWTSLTR